MRHSALLLGWTLLAACHSEEQSHASRPVAPAAPVEDAGVAAPPSALTALGRDAFNQAAQEKFLPLFWRSDANGNKALDPDELVVLWGPWTVTRAQLVSPDGKTFTAQLRSMYDALQAPDALVNTSDDERTRQTLLKSELEQGAPTLLETDPAALSAAERALLAELSQAALLVEKLYARQHGIDGLAAQIPAGDTRSQAVFHRNQSPFCVAPKTEKVERCAVLATTPSRAVGLYPAALQAEPKFCTKLEREKNRVALMDHFTAVVADGAHFKAVPFSEAFKDDMEAVAAHLEAGAALLTGGTEAALERYLRAAAKAFRTNDWEGANEAWVAMSATNSRWYLRVAPDEVYAEPCAWKANFALQLARINPDSLAWQKKLDPVKGEMEKQVAALAGAPYRAREVKFRLPDFIDVVLNAGDQRNPHGATAGQSLPNWGPTSEKGGRTVVMTNLSSDLDSRKVLGQQMASLFCKDTLAMGNTEPKSAILSVVLHEAAHNLGPAHDYAVKGQKAEASFGGPLASTMEELKAQTSALYFTWWLVDRKLVSEEDAIAATVRDLAWAFSHSARGMYDGGGAPKTYSQLAAIELGTAVKDGALRWRASELAANGQDHGCFELDLVKWRGSVAGLEKAVLQLKAKGDRAAAEKLKAEFVDAKGDFAALRETIADRWLRAPKATFVYAF